MNPVYFDNAATTPLRKEVVEAMTKVLNETFGNASSTHGYGRSSKAILESCRKQIATLFNVSAAEIIFTSGGTEANNFILQSAVESLGVEHIITSKVEHHAILHTAEALANSKKVEVSYVKLKEATIDFNHFEELLQSDKKTLVALMHINNEVGTILDIEKAAKLAKDFGALFHSDTVQSVGHLNLDLQQIPADFIISSAHKFHGPKGVGFAFIRKNSGLKPIFFGGEQERGYRPGTEALHNIVGLTEALKLSYSNLADEKTYILSLKTYFIEELKKHISDIQFNGLSDDLSKSSYTILNVRLPKTKVQGDMIQFQLDLKGIACSRGSACQSGSVQASHVLMELLSPEELQKPSIRFSLSSFNTREEVDYVVSTLKDLIN